MIDLMIDGIISYIQPFLAALVLLATAELGDKTQIMTISFAARYRLASVLGSVLLATALLNLLAVILGKFVALYLPISAIKIGAGLLFIAFGLWTLTANDGAEIKTSQASSPFWAIFGTFFLAELGDKTQVAVIALSAHYNKPFQIWLGATLGMGLANIFGIAVGNRLGAALPEKTVKRTAGLLFIAFGLLALGDFIINSLC